MFGNQSSENPTGTLTRRDEEALARHSHLGLLRYKDPYAGFCTACSCVFGVTCPRCGAESGREHGKGELFKVDHPIAPILVEGFAWVPVQCLKCDFRFKVIVHPRKAENG